MDKFGRVKLIPETYANILHKVMLVDGSPGLVVMGGNSFYEGCGFESQHQILVGFFHTLVLKFVIFV